jgi:hypothetical protein
MVALVGHADDAVAETEGEQQLGRVRHERHDAAGPAGLASCGRQVVHYPCLWQT